MKKPDTKDKVTECAWMCILVAALYLEYIFFSFLHIFNTTAVHPFDVSMSILMCCFAAMGICLLKGTMERLPMIAGIGVAGCVLQLFDHITRYSTVVESITSYDSYTMKCYYLYIVVLIAEIAVFALAAISALKKEKAEKFQKWLFGAIAVPMVGMLFICVFGSSSSISGIIVMATILVWVLVSNNSPKGQATKGKRNAPPATSTADRVEKLSKLKELLDSGVITQEEFETKKKHFMEQ